MGSTIDLNYRPMSFTESELDVIDEINSDLGGRIHKSRVNKITIPKI